ncbi:MAG: ABC transporter ATP-binding protein [Dehalococcoidia bacterium]|nr:ABC transporter ATP-binding protein [Dehalococcoidia bacterium]MDH4299187.1 ABC transporter ATP-binding protein [Dehalococcoidia bacterium]MDH4366814.1 ABC transporter ATP-binding protein [Dehalococcoidia bacterium]
MLEVKNVSKVYGEGTAKVVALDNISLLVNEGDFTAVMGPSGSGKSTLLNIIGGLDHVSSGEVILDGQRIDSLDENALVDVRRGKIAYVFQQYHLIPSLTALENVLLPLTFGGANNNNRKALDILRRVGLEKRADHKPSQLSGGEQQRVAIARALVNDPSLILADEPTGNMDRKTGKEILALFHQLNKEGRSVVMVTHDPEIAGYAKEVVVLQDGRIVDKVNRKEGNKC